MNLSNDLVWSELVLPDGHHTGHPDQLADPVHRLIHDQLVTETTLPEINKAVGNHLRNAKQRDPRQQTDNESVGPRMSRQPPTPVEGDVLARTFLNCHAVALQHEITDEMRQQQQDQKIE